MISAVITYEDNKVSIHSSRTRHVGKKFKSGYYKAWYDGDERLNIVQTKIPEDHSLVETKENKLIKETVRKFFKSNIKQSISDLGFTHKLGILLYGVQGTGKTSILNKISQILVKESDAIVLVCNTMADLEGGIDLAYMIREIQDNPIIIISDEFERFALEMESLAKNFLDGLNSIDNSLFLAATNYLDQIPDTLKDRPSRFKVVQEIKGFTDKQHMRDVLKDLSKKTNPNLFTDEEIEKKIKDIDSITLDELKHIALDKITNTSTLLDNKNHRVSGFGGKKSKSKTKSKFGLSRPKSDEKISPGDEDLDNHSNI